MSTRPSIRCFAKLSLQSDGSTSSDRFGRDRRFTRHIRFGSDRRLLLAALSAETPSCFSGEVSLPDGFVVEILALHISDRRATRFNVIEHDLSAAGHADRYRLSGANVLSDLSNRFVSSCDPIGPTTTGQYNDGTRLEQT